MLKQIDEDITGPPSPRPVSQVGVLCFVSIIITFLSGGLWWNVRSSFPASMENLRQMSVVFRMYAREHGEYPPLTRYAGYWMVDLETLYPDYISDLDIFVSPRSHYDDELFDEMRRLADQEPKDWEAITRLASWSYIYLPWEVGSEEEFALVAKHISELPRDGQPLGGRLVIGDKTFMPHTRPEEAPANRAGSATPVDIQELLKNPVVFENTDVLRSRRWRTGVLGVDGSVWSPQEGTYFPATEAMRSLIDYAPPHRTDGTPFQTIFDRKKSAAVIAMSAPIALGVVLLIVAVAGRIGAFQPFAVFMLYLPYMAVASHIVYLPLYFQYSLLFIPFSAILSWILGLWMYGDCVRTSGSSGVGVRLPWCGYWLVMFYLMVIAPIGANMGGAYL